MSDFAHAYAQSSTLARRPEGDTLLLAAYAENVAASGAACFFEGQLRDSWLAIPRLTILV